jgi:SAM-dependent methyltransferase
MIDFIKRYKFYIFLKNNYNRLRYFKYRNYPGLKGKIHHKDSMFDNINHYMSVGESAMKNIEESLKMADISFDSLNSVLDIPCGYGRVLRLLTTKVPPEKITACEIEKSAIDFCEKEFGCKKFLSNEDLSSVHFPEKYSLIWVGSLFTHLDEKGFVDLFKLLFDSLENKGVLVFTTLGKYSVEIFQQYWGLQEVISKEELERLLAASGGFYFTPYVNEKSYGTTISLKEYITSLANRLYGDDAKIFRYVERGWDNHQDVFSIQKR